MPVNFQQIQTQIHEMGEKAGERQRILLDRLNKAQNLLHEHASRLTELRNLLESALSYNANLRCAIPGEQPLTHATPAPSIPGHPLTLAADGSQVFPSHHDAVEFGVINIGIFRITPGTSQTPREETHTTLLYGESLQGKDGVPLTEDIIALRRDLGERTVLARLAAQEAPPVLSLTDGPLELFRQPSNSKEYDALFQEYMQVLRDLSRQGGITAGYVDKPRSDLVVRLLELTLLPPEALRKAGKERPLAQVTDAALFGSLLQPGDRTAVFGIQSISAQNFTEALELHFFYLNVGRVGLPKIARVELPRWVMDDPSLLDLLHGSLLEQCRQLASQPYPYSLHRAHEIALVTQEEKRQLANLIALELYRRGILVDEQSAKQTHKDQVGTRTRYS